MTFVLLKRRTLGASKLMKGACYINQSIMADSYYAALLLFSGVKSGDYITCKHGTKEVSGSYLIPCNEVKIDMVITSKTLEALV